MRIKGIIAVLVLIAVAYGAWNLVGGLFGKNEPVASDKPLATDRDYLALCHPKNPKYFPDAAPYTGQGPHPTKVFADQSSVLVETSDENDRYPAVWNAGSEQVREVQLVACLDDPEDGERVGECTFTSPDDESFPLYRGIYDVTLYEARTGRKVTEVKGLRGEDKGGCPSFVYRRSTDNSGFHTDIDPAELRRALGQYVE